MTKAKISLLDEEDDAAPVNFTVNADFAKRFEHNKKRAELHRLQEKYPELASKIERQATRNDDNEDEESSTSEEEDEGEIADETNAGIFETLLRIRKRDPVIYEKDVKFFKDEEEEDEAADGEDKGGKTDKKKPLYLKDMLAKQALEHGPELADDEDDESDARRRLMSDQRKVKAYDAEQEAMRQAFLEAVEKNDSDIDLKAKPNRVDLSDSSNAKPESKKVVKLVDEYFKDIEDLDPNERFLKQFILHKGWVDRGSDDDGDDDEDDDDGNDDAEGEGKRRRKRSSWLKDEDDEEFDEQADRFESTYNFRFEEPGADRLISHPRVISDAVRKEDSKRRRQRDAKAERVAQEKERMDEEVKQLKNLKKQEIETRVSEMQKAAGRHAPSIKVVDSLLDGDFDPEEWDKLMGNAFDDEYYGEEEDPEELFEGGEEELANLNDLEGAEEESDGEGEEEGDAPAGSFKALKRRLRAQMSATEAKDSDEDEEGEESGDEEDDGEDDDENEKEKKKGKKKNDNSSSSKTKAKKSGGEERAALQQLLEEYYKLDFEDEVGGIRTRFKYRSVAPSTFGMNFNDILALPDKDLNQIIGLKKLAPYREGVEKVRPNYKALQQLTKEQRQKEAKELKKAGRSSDYKKLKQEEKERKALALERRKEREEHRKSRKAESRKKEKERKKDGKKEEKKVEKKEEKEQDKKEKVDDKKRKREEKKAEAGLENGDAKKDETEKSQVMNVDGEEKRAKKPKKEAKKEDVSLAATTTSAAVMAVPASRLASYAKLSLGRDGEGNEGGEGQRMRSGKGGEAWKKGGSSEHKKDREDKGKEGKGSQKGKGVEGSGKKGEAEKEREGKATEVRKGKLAPETVASLAHMTKAQRKNAKRLLKKKQEA